MRYVFKHSVRQRATYASNVNGADAAGGNGGAVSKLPLQTTECEHSGILERWTAMMGSAAVAVDVFGFVEASARYD